MLEDEPRGIEPIIEDLTSHNMPPNTPAILPPLVPQPVMTQHLRVKVMRLETRMMNVTFGAFEEEKAVVVHELFSTIKSAEAIELAASGIVDQLRWEEVEASGVELEGLRKVANAHSEMAEFVNRRRGFFEALECVRRTCLLFRLYNNQQSMYGLHFSKWKDKPT